VARHKQHSSDKDYSSNSGMTPDAYNDTRSTSGYDPESTPVRKSSTSSMPASPAAWQLDVGDDDMRSLENASKLSTIRMKLEEKRRRIEQDKRKIEMALLRHQEKVGFDSLALSLLTYLETYLDVFAGGSGVVSGRDEVGDHEQRIEAHARHGSR